MSAQYTQNLLQFLPARVSEQGNWRASKASETLFSHVYGNSRYNISYFTSKSGIWLVISRVASYFHEPEASANTAYE